MMKLASTTAVAALMLAAAPAFAQTASPTAPAATTAPAVGFQYVDRQMEGQWLASEFMGETVRGPADENIGEINNLLFDKDGKVVAAVIGVGGFLGIGEKDVAVPFTELQLSNEQDGRITLAATKDQLRNAPEFHDLDDQDDNAAATGMPASTTPARPMAPAPGTSTAPAAPAQ